jgi:hypothetical protein
VYDEPGTQVRYVESFALVSHTKPWLQSPSLWHAQGVQLLEYDESGHE